MNFHFLFKNHGIEGEFAYQYSNIGELAYKIQVQCIKNIIIIKIKT